MNNKHCHITNFRNLIVCQKIVLMVADLLRVKLLAKRTTWDTMLMNVPTKKTIRLGEKLITIRPPNIIRKVPIITFFRPTLKDTRHTYLV